MDDDPDEKPDDLLALLVRQPRVQARSHLGKEVTGLLGHDLGL
jgi:hypothetical protein